MSCLKDPVFNFQRRSRALLDNDELKRLYSLLEANSSPSVSPDTLPTSSNQGLKHSNIVIPVINSQFFILSTFLLLCICRRDFGKSGNSGNALFPQFPSTYPQMIQKNHLQSLAIKLILIYEMSLTFCSRSYKTFFFVFRFLLFSLGRRPYLARTSFVIRD